MFVKFTLSGDDCHCVEQEPVPPEVELDNVAVPPEQMVVAPLTEMVGSATTLTMTWSDAEQAEPIPKVTSIVCDGAVHVGVVNPPQFSLLISGRTTKTFAAPGSQLQELVLTERTTPGDPAQGEELARHPVVTDQVFGPTVTE